MSVPSFAPFVLKRPWLSKIFKPLATWYSNASGYRKLGLRSDDLIPEEDPIVITALKRLTPKESYDRVFRLRRAMQCSVTHTLLPAEQQTKPEEDIPYLTPLIKEIEAEYKERADLEALKITKKK